MCEARTTSSLIYFRYCREMLKGFSFTYVRAETTQKSLEFFKALYKSQQLQKTLQTPVIRDPRKALGIEKAVHLLSCMSRTELSSSRTIL